MNTRIDYRYKNGAGLVLCESVVIKGELQPSQIIPFFINGEFIPAQVDLPILNGKDLEVDGPFHEILNIDSTQDEATINITADEVVENFKTAAQHGWDESYFYKEILTQAAAALNGFFVQEPKELASTTNLIVRLQSAEHGDEDFRHFNLEHAVDKIVELCCEALKCKDGIERSIGLVVNPGGQGTVVTVYRSASSNMSLMVLPEDLSWACSELGTEEPQPIKNNENERAFSDSINFDLLKSFLKQKELLIRQTDTKGD